MSRHVGKHAGTSPRPLAALRSRRAMIVAAVIAVGLVAGLVWVVRTPAADDDSPCANPQTVRLAVAPELGGLVKDLLADPVPVGSDACAVAEVVAQEPLETVANLSALEESGLPQVWVPDSSLWRARAPEVELDAAGSLTSSPIVLATNQAAVDNLGWGADPPTWSEVLAAGRPLAVPNLAANIEALSAMAAVRSSLGGGEDADNAVVQVALTAARGTVPAPAEAIAAAIDGGAGAPLGALSEQEIVTTNQGAGNTKLIAIYPADGSPMLDYPVLRVGQHGRELRAAIDAVVDVLTSEAAHQQAQELGFRGLDGAAPLGDLTGLREEAPQELPLDAAEVQTLLARLSALAIPSSLLTVIDISTSMRAPVDGGTRATLARDAAKSALTLLPDTARIALWFFATELDGGADWTEVVPLRTLGADAGGLPQRQVLATQLDTIPDRLSPGGTSLYDSTLAAVRAARDSYDADFVNGVVIMTDGKNEDTAGVQLPELLDTLRSEADEEHPIQVIGIALGAEADLGALQQIGDATGGAAYSAADPRDLQSVLFSALAQRR